MATHILLALTWGYTMCNIRGSKCIIDPLEHFTMHGLWPTTAYPPYPAYCEDVSYDDKEIDPIEQELTNIWPSYLSDNHQFWEHEWDKHGTCSLNNPYTLTQFDYFNHSLNVYSEYDPRKKLDQEGIVPNGTYSITEFKDVLGYAYNLHCFKNYLEEIRISFDSKWNLIPSPIPDACPDEIVYEYV